LQQLGLKIESASSSKDLAGMIASFARNVLRSSENNIREAIIAGTDLQTFEDLRTILSRIAVDSYDPEVQESARALIMQIDGQQVINQGARNDGNAAHLPPAYICMPILAYGEQSVLEMKLWPRDQQRESAEDDAESMPLRASIRVNLSPLGKIQADIAGEMHGELHCRIWSESPQVSQFISANSTSLAISLKSAGWQYVDISCRIKRDWPPFCAGSDALWIPRGRIDRKA
jgi:hypothetical protein